MTNIVPAKAIQAFAPVGPDGVLIVSDICSSEKRAQELCIDLAFGYSARSSMSDKAMKLAIELLADKGYRAVPVTISPSE